MKGTEIIIGGLFLITMGLLQIINPPYGYLFCFIGGGLIGVGISMVLDDK